MPERAAPSDPAAFRELVQRGVVESPGESWYGPLVSRRVSHRIARRLVARGASADAVTAAMVACGLLGVGLFLLPPGWAWVAGALLLHAWLVLDAVDGEVARGRGEASVRGVYLDAFGHALVNPGLLSALAWAARMLPGDVRWAMALLGFASLTWSRAAAEAVTLARGKALGPSAGARYAGLARRAPGLVKGREPAPRGGRPAARERFGRLRVFTDAASPVLVLSAAAVLAVAAAPGTGGVEPVWGMAPDAERPIGPAGPLAALGWLVFTAAHLAKAALLAWDAWRSLPGPAREARPAHPGGGAGEAPDDAARETPGP